MTDAAGLWPDVPIKPLPPGARVANPLFWVPRVEIVVGRDAASGGMSIGAYRPTEGRVWSAEALLVKRWRDAPQSVEECLRIAQDGLRWYLEGGDASLT